MRILMLGWEFPPFIAGGLGVACYGLTKALDERGHDITFVLPHAIHAGPVNHAASHVRLLGPSSSSRPPSSSTDAQADRPPPGISYTREDFERTIFHAVPMSFSNPYSGAAPLTTPASGASPLTARTLVESGEPVLRQAPARPGEPRPRGAWAPPSSPYGGDLLADADRYARLVVALVRDQTFDIIHAHDWLTYPAGAAAAAALGCPWVAHVHSTEFDRSGDQVNPRIYELERRGMHGATRVIAVSQLTKTTCVGRYGVSPGKIDVVYNGVQEAERGPGSRPMPAPVRTATDKIVLFLGRITMQKGPEYFLAAAKSVLEVEPGTKFVLAGSGDLDQPLRALAKHLGIDARVHFTGFLRGADVQQALQLADCFVMPSVSEPFGLVALEAAQRGVPVILSRQSGASEVLQHVLKVDFWDTQDLANKIIAVLRSPGLSRTLVENNAADLLALSWDASADTCVGVYTKARQDSPWAVTGSHAQG